MFAEREGGKAQLFVALTRIHLCSDVFKKTKKKFSTQKMLLVNKHHFLLQLVAAVWAPRAPTTSKTKHLESQIARSWRWNVPLKVGLHLPPLDAPSAHFYTRTPWALLFTYLFFFLIGWGKKRMRQQSEKVQLFTQLRKQQSFVVHCFRFNANNDESAFHQ